MDLDQIKAVATIYKTKINNSGCIKAIRFDPTELANFHGRYPHLLWMCEEILNGNVDGEKVHRWLGFIQGVLFDDCQFTIAQLKEHNK